jgi:hypothetical protein
MLAHTGRKYLKKFAVFGFLIQFAEQSPRILVGNAVVVFANLFHGIGCHRVSLPTQVSKRDLGHPNKNLDNQG